MKWFLVLLIRIYQMAISPFLGKNCRFYPSCSQYTKQAVEKHGIKGIFIGLKRLLRCHPFSKGGFDPLE